MAYDLRDELQQDARTPATVNGDTGGSFAGVDSYNYYFNYDLAGNPTNFKGASPGLTSNSFNVDNQIGNSGFVFDGSGNLTTNFTDGSSFGNTFDPESRLTNMPAGHLTDQYDGDDLRAVKTARALGTTTTTYFLPDEDGQPLVEETFSGTTATITRVHAIGADGEREVYDGPSGQFYAYAFDPEGNLTLRDNSDNTFNWATDITLYDAYGTPLIDQTPDNQTVNYHDPAGFAAQWGGYTDWEVASVSGNQLASPVLMTHRYFDSRTGRRTYSFAPATNPYGLRLLAMDGVTPVTRR